MQGACRVGQPLPPVVISIHHNDVAHVKGVGAEQEDGALKHIADGVSCVGACSRRVEGRRASRGHPPAIGGRSETPALAAILLPGSPNTKVKARTIEENVSQACSQTQQTQYAYAMPICMSAALALALVTSTLKMAR